MTGAADSLDTGLVSEPVEKRKPRIKAEYAFDTGFRACSVRGDVRVRKIKRMFW